MHASRVSAGAEGEELLGSVPCCRGLRLFSDSSRVSCSARFLLNVWLTHGC